MQPTTGRRILIINGHPDAGQGHFGDALVTAYADAARQAGHTVEELHVAALQFPLVSSKEDWESGTVPPDILHAQERIVWAEHLVFFYPLWLGSMPALLKGFLEQILRPGFAFSPVTGGMHSERLLGGRSARIVITMGMPAIAFRLYFGAHSLKTLRRNILGFCGIAPIHSTLIGLVETRRAGHRERALHKLATLGRRGR